MDHIKFLAWVSLILLSPLPTVAQKRAAPSQPRPAPHFTGELVTTDGARRLTLQRKHNSKCETFAGTIQSTCMAPARSKRGESKPLDLSRIPVGTVMTAFYVRHGQKGEPAKSPENVILAIRVDRVRDHGPALRQGVPIPCFKRARQAGE